MWQQNYEPTRTIEEALKYRKEIMIKSVFHKYLNGTFSLEDIYESLETRKTLKSNESSKIKKAQIFPGNKGTILIYWENNLIMDTLLFVGEHDKEIKLIFKDDKLVSETIKLLEKGPESFDDEAKDPSNTIIKKEFLNDNKFSIKNILEFVKVQEGRLIDWLTEVNLTTKLELAY